jgi:peptidoglycan/LPS O-acetylase OafA/YrhL
MLLPRMGRDRLGYVPALDGLRGVAILLVIGRHAFFTPVGGGYGVDLFFVLSGFLITNLLLEERGATGSIRFRRFYARRARRLLPALFAMLAVYLAVETAAGRAGEAARRAMAAGFYTANVFQAFWPHVIGRSSLGPLWSLAQEEQFYLVAPLLLLLLVRRVSERTVRRVVFALIAAVVVERIALTLVDGATQRIYVGPDTHSDGLLLGTALALSLRESARKGAARYDRLLGPGSALLLALGVGNLWVAWGFQVMLVNLAAVGLVCCAVAQPRSAITRSFSCAPLVFIGRISYSLYLWNMPLLFWLGSGNSPQRAPLAVLLTFAAAWLSYRYVEQPLRQRRAGTPELGNHAPGVLALPVSVAIPVATAYSPDS